MNCQLSSLKKGQRAYISHIGEDNVQGERLLPTGELERRLLEMGFAEGAEVILMHEGPFGRDPIVVLLRSCHLIALRKQEAQAILVALL